MQLHRFAARAGAGLLALGAGVLLMGTAASTTLAAPHPKAASGYTLFGDATLVHPGNASPTAVQASYDGSASYGGVDFAVPAGLTVSRLNNLATDYRFTVGTCGGGSPRFGATVTNGTTSGTIFFYIGPPPSYTGCPPNVWQNTGNLASPTNLVDDSQVGGMFYDPYAAVQARIGSYQVTDLFIVVDGFQPAPQTAQFDNTNINGTLYTYETADSCKSGGWQQFTSAPGPFKNQGDCVSYFATGGKNKGNG